MSNSASIAAAKNRRARPTQVTFQENPKNTENKQLTKEKIDEKKENSKLPIPKTPLQALNQHNYRLNILENIIQNYNFKDYISKQDLELFKIEHKISNKIDKTNNSIDNQVNSNCLDIISLKNSYTLLEKSIDDLKSNITILNASLLTLTNDFNENRNNLYNLENKELSEEKSDKEENAKIQNDE